MALLKMLKIKIIFFVDKTIIYVHKAVKAKKYLCCHCSFPKMSTYPSNTQWEIYFFYIATCGGSYFGSSGTFSSPNYPANYDNNLNCTWVVQGPVGHFLTFTFVGFQLPTADNCSLGDYVEIRDINETGLCNILKNIPKCLPPPHTHTQYISLSVCPTITSCVRLIYSVIN